MGGEDIPYLGGTGRLEGRHCYPYFVPTGTRTHMVMVDKGKEYDNFPDTSRASVSCEINTAPCPVR